MSDKPKSDKPKSVGDKVIDILHSVLGTSEEDPVAAVIKKSRDEDSIFAKTRKKRDKEAGLEE